LLITIITPNYNYSQYLKESLNSVAKSFGKIEYEHLVLDGKSTDGSHKILQEWQSLSGTNRWVNMNDTGQTDALQKLLLEAKGEWIGWLNSDEIYCNDSIIKFIELVQSDKSVDVVYGDTEFITDVGNPIRLKSLYPFSSFVLKYYGPYIQTSSFFFRNPKALGKSEISFDSKFEYSMDWDFFLKLHKAGYKFVYIPILLSKFRVHAEAKTQRYTSADRVFERQLIIKDFNLNKNVKQSYARIWHIALRFIYLSYFKELWHFVLRIKT
jgi:glycosyltransferase involved in cell wall biosynthesis